MNCSPPLFHLLDWDSNAFGFAVARIEALSDPVAQLPQIRLALAEANVTLAYWEAPVRDEIYRRAATSNGGRLINSRVVFDIELGKRHPPYSFEELNQPDKVQATILEKLALASGWSSRFALDREFPDTLFEKLYRTWLKNSLNRQIADAILILQDGGKINAMVTVSATAGHGQIGLFSVDEAARGNGLGKKLLNDALDWFAANGCSTATVVTQGENMPAMALYQSCGFVVGTHNDVFHFWNHQS